MRANGIAAFSLVGTVQFWDFEDLGEVQFDLATIPEWYDTCEFTRCVLRNGSKQKIADAAAGPKTRAAKFAAMTETAKNLATQIWIGDRTTLLETALLELYPSKTEEEIREFVKALADEEKKEMEREKAVAAKIAEIRSRNAPPVSEAMATKLATFAG